MRRKYGEPFTIQLLVVAINDLLTDINAGKSMSATQVMRAAELLQRKYYMLNIYDFRICFDRIRLGEYGKLFDVFDITKLGECLDLYLNERLEIAESISMKQHELAKENIVLGELPTDRQEFYAAYQRDELKRKEQAELEQKKQDEQDAKDKEFARLRMNYQPPQEDGNERFERIMEQKADRGA